MKSSARQDVALVALRVVVGAIFIAHGAQKLFALFGGPGIVGQGRFFETAACVAPGICLRPGVPLAVLSGVGEFGGGLLLLLGLLVPLGGLLLIADMLVAMIFYSGPKFGFFNPSSGLEMNLAMVATTVSVILLGSGRYGLDRLLAQAGDSIP
jgi:putative oxidoreductase